MDEDQAQAQHITDTSSPFTSVPIEVVVSVGKARPLVRDLVQLDTDSILTLDKAVSDPVELYVGDRMIARGELEEIEGEQGQQLAVRVTEINPVFPDV